ncbi:MAG: hypothetical protein SGBAC_005699 [Bacillariaceae sp.]
MRSFGTQAWTPPKGKTPEASESSMPAWKKATQKQASTVYLDEDENDIAAMFFGAGGGGGAQSGTGDDEKVDDDDDDDVAALFHSAGATTTGTTSKDDQDAAAFLRSAGGTTTHATSTDDEDAAALFFAAQEESNNGAQDDDSSSSEGSRSRSPDSDSDNGSDGGQDDSSRNSDNSGSGSDSSRNDNDDDSQSSRSSNSSNSSESKSGGSSSGSDDDDRSQRSGSSRSSGSYEEVEVSDDDDGRSQSDESTRSDGSSRSSKSGNSNRSGSSRSDTSRRSDRSGSSRSNTSRRSDRSGSSRSRSDKSSRSTKSGSSRSGRSSRSARSRSSGSQSERDDDNQSNTSRSGDSGGGSTSDDGSRSSRSSGSEGSSRSKSSRSSRSSKSGSDSESGSERSDDDTSKSDGSSRSSSSGNGSAASGDAQPAEGSATKEKSRDEAIDAEKKENAEGASVPKPAKIFPKPVNTKPVKSFPKVETSSTPPAIKAPDVKSKPAYVKPSDGMAPWQSELKKRKETGAKTVGWKKPKKEQATVYVEDDEDDIAALFFEAGGGKPKSAKFSFGGDAQSTSSDDAAAMVQSAGQTNAAIENKADDAAAMFQSAGQTITAVDNIGDDDAAVMFQSAEPTESATEQSNGDAAVMSQSVGRTESTQNETSEYITLQSESQEAEPMPVDSGDEEFVEVVEDEGDAGDEVVLEEVEEIEEVEEGEEVEEEIIMEEYDEADAEEQLIIELDEEYVDDETVATSNEQEVAERLALGERRLAQQRAYAEMERVEFAMRNYIATLAHDESARSIHSDQSSVPWAMATNPDHDPASSYASYIQAARERRMDDQSSYFKPDMEMPSDDSLAETDTFASSEQRSIPWGLEVRESDSWANPMRPLQATRKADALHPTGKKDNVNATTKASMLMPNTTNPSTKTASNTCRKAPNGRKRRAPTGFGEMVSAEVFKTSVPDPERETELWYHPGFAFLSQNPNMKPYFPPAPRTSQNNSLNGSEGTDKAVVSDLEIAQLMYNNSVPASSNVTLLSYGEKTISQWNMLESSGRRADQSFSSSNDESDELKLPDFSNTIFRTASPWIPNGSDSESSSDSLSYTMLVPFEDESSDEEKRRNVVFSRSGSSVSIDLEVETFEYVPEPSFSNRPDSESTLETGSVKSTRRLPCGIYGFMSLCFCLVLVPASVAIVLFITGQNGETAPRAVNPNFTFPTRAPTIPPTNLNGTMDGASEAPSPGPPPIVGPIPTLQPTVFDPVMDDPVTEDLLFRLLASVSVDNGEALRNRRSPQFAALEWLRSPAGFNGVSNDAIFLQRYALATLYYSTAGESWAASDLWLSDADECDWFSSGGSLLCNNEGMITALALTNNGLNGKLPNEIGILSRLETIMLSGNTNLTGPVPRSFQNLSNLQNIFIEGTGLSALPPNICDLPLQEFWANCEELGCNCCNECFY